MSAINFPNNPALNEEFTQGDKVYRWNGFRWRAIPASLITIKGQLASANSLIDTLTESLTNANSSIDTLSESLTNANSSIDTLSESLTTVTSDLENVSDNKAETAAFTTTIGASDTWTPETGYFTLTKTVTDILVTDEPIVDIDLSNADLEDIDGIQAAWGTIYFVETKNNEVVFYSLEDPDFPANTVVKFKVVR
jgi:uncharacterized coiled-coil protein SlyX